MIFPVSSFFKDWPVHVFNSISGLVGSTLNAEAAGRTTFHVGSAFGVLDLPLLLMFLSKILALDYCSFELEYDEDIVEVWRVSKGELLSADDYFDFDEHEDGIITVSWEKDTGFIDDDGVLFYISFLALEEGSTDLYVQNLYLNSEEMPYIIDGYISNIRFQRYYRLLEISAVSIYPEPTTTLLFPLPLGPLEALLCQMVAGRWEQLIGAYLSSSGTISGTPPAPGGLQRNHTRNRLLRPN